MELSEDVTLKLVHCKLLALDFDGVLTDNKVYVNDQGQEMVRCDRGDSLGLDILKKQGRVEVIIVSKETNAVVQKRGEKLRIPVYSGIDDKAETLREAATERGIAQESVCFVGNDVNDLPAFESAGVKIAVADAHPDLIAQSDYCTKALGGEGAVREVCELIMTSQSSEKV